MSHFGGSDLSLIPYCVIFQTMLPFSFTNPLEGTNERQKASRIVKSLQDGVLSRGFSSFPLKKKTRCKKFNP